MKTIIPERHFAFLRLVCVGIFSWLTFHATAQNLFEADEDSGNIYEFSNGVQITFASGLSFPAGLAFNGAGNLFVACYGSGSIVEITPAGVQSTFVSDLNKPFDLAFNNAGNLFVTCTSGGLSETGQILEFTPTGTQATYASGLQNPTSLAFNDEGNLFVMVYTNGNELMRIPSGAAIIEITSGGAKSTYLSLGSTEDFGLAFNSDDDLFVANYSSSGSVTEYVGGESPATYLSGLDDPRLMTFDNAGDLFVANSGANNIIERPLIEADSTLGSGLDYPAGLAVAPPPPLQIVDAGFQMNQFGFTLIGSNNQAAVVEVCTDLASMVWTPVTTNTLTNGSSYFSDPQWTNNSSRYYRLSSPP